MADQSVYKSKNITMCSDGKYRLVYELDMYKSPAIIKEVLRGFRDGRRRTVDVAHFYVQRFR